MADLAGLSLYEFNTCPYCARVRNFIAEQGQEIELRDVSLERSHLMDLIAATGSQMVPCLRIEVEDGTVQWMHESADIIEYLKQRFAEG
jgi:glutathione S-transferase